MNRSLYGNSLSPVTSAPGAAANLRHSKPAPKKCPRILPLPKFSDKVRRALEDGSVSFMMGDFTKECAFHICSNGDINKKGEYAMFSKSLVEQYRSLQRDHSFVSRRISGTVRTMHSKDKEDGANSSANTATCSISQGIHVIVSEATECLQHEFASSQQNCHRIE